MAQAVNILMTTLNACVAQTAFYLSTQTAKSRALSKLSCCEF